jgi:hypothetical protein
MLGVAHFNFLKILKQHLSFCDINLPSMSPFTNDPSPTYQHHPGTWLRMIWRKRMSGVNCRGNSQIVASTRFVAVSQPVEQRLKKRFFYCATYVFFYAFILLNNKAVVTFDMRYSTSYADLGLTRHEHLCFCYCNNLNCSAWYRAPGRRVTTLIVGLARTGNRTLGHLCVKQLH